MSQDSAPNTPAGQSIHGLWATRAIFILAAAGSAIGLGSIWKFPYVTGMHGGGAFVLVYLACVLLVGVPLMMAEILMGRRGRASPVHAVQKLAHESGLGKRWVALGWLGTFAAFLILSFYTMIAGWGLHYTVLSAQGTFTGIAADASTAVFDSLKANPLAMLLWHTLFMAMTIVVVARGVQAGLERAVRWLMPILFALLFVLLGYAFTTGQFLRGMEFLFAADFSRVDGEMFLVALGQVFFTLSLGMASMMAYGAYMPHGQSIARSTVMIVALDTLFSLIAGLAIFPIVFAWNLEPAQGPGLMFVTLPLAFGNLPWGALFGTLFFALVVVAAWVSAIALAEPFVAWAVEKGMRRAKAATLVGVAAWALGILSVLSFNVLSGEDFRIAGRSFYEAIDFLATNILLPLGGILIAVFVGWAMKETKVMKELAMQNQALYIAWRIAIRIVVPLAIVLIMADFFGAPG
ncbi:MAG: sodium-dependent transporter [Pseudomonadota bacterium]